ncbi:MAG TPA: hypothetical protein VEY71_11135, partial [Chitinophagales bacterium]|nr:hypothetical protein [Chitinophagales bacterium]
FRFNTLGYTEERLVYLDRTSGRNDELQEVRRSRTEPLRNKNNFNERVDDEAGSMESEKEDGPSRRKELEALRNLGDDGVAKRKSM